MAAHAKFLVLIPSNMDTKSKKLMSIFVYSGDGTERVDVLFKSLQNGLKELKVDYEIKLIKSDEIQNALSQPSAKLFILPGGRDMPFVRDISDDTVNSIKEFVFAGGSYLGLCAGAYFSCSYVCFEPRTPLEVKGPRRLKMFQGTGKGSVYPGFIYKSTKGSRIAPLQCNGALKDSLGVTSYAYFNGGCQFIPDTEFIEYETMATYGDYEGQNAIVSILGRKGKIILSGVHPEMDANYLNSTEYTPDQWRRMQEYEGAQRKLFLWYLEHLLK